MSSISRSDQISYLKRLCAQSWESRVAAAIKAMLSKDFQVAFNRTGKDYKHNRILQGDKISFSAHLESLVIGN